MESDIFTLTEARRIPGPTFPLVIEPAREEIDAVGWATAQRRPIRELLLRHGGVLFRGFTAGSVESWLPARWRIPSRKAGRSRGSESGRACRPRCLPC